MICNWFGFHHLDLEEKNHLDLIETSSYPLSDHSPSNRGNNEYVSGGNNIPQHHIATKKTFFVECSSQGVYQQAYFNCYPHSPVS